MQRTLLTPTITPKTPSTSQQQTFVAARLIIGHHSVPSMTGQWRGQKLRHEVQRVEREIRQMRGWDAGWEQHDEQWLRACLDCIFGWFDKDS